MSARSPRRSPPEPSPAERVRALLRAHFAAGLEVSGATAAFIESTCGGEALDRLAGGDFPGGAEAESLIALLLGPEEDLVERVEAFLGETGWSRGEIEKAAAALCRETPRIPLRLPGRGEGGTLPLTPPRAEGFLERLGVGLSLPGALLRALADAAPGTHAMRLRVRLRRARIAWAPETVAFCLLLLERLDPGRPEDEEAFSFALELLAEAPAAVGIESWLETRRGLLLRARERGRRQRELLSSAPVETLLARGERLVAVDEEGIARELSRLDRLALAAFGRRFPPDEAPARLDLHGAGDVEDLFRRLL